MTRAFKARQLVTQLLEVAGALAGASHFSWWIYSVFLLPHEVLLVRLLGERGKHGSKGNLSFAHANAAGQFGLVHVFDMKQGEAARILIDVSHGVLIAFVDPVDV